MALKISYWTKSKFAGLPIVGTRIGSSESLALSGTTAQTTGTTPTNADIVKFEATESCAVEYTSSNPTAVAATSHYMSAGSVHWQDAVTGYKVAGIQA